MGNHIQENMKRELWFNYFNDYLYKNNAITSEEKNIISRRITTMNNNK